MRRSRSSTLPKVALRSLRKVGIVAALVGLSAACVLLTTPPAGASTHSAAHATDSAAQQTWVIFQGKKWRVVQPIIHTTVIHTKSGIEKVEIIGVPASPGRSRALRPTDVVDECDAAQTSSYISDGNYVQAKDWIVGCTGGVDECVSAAFVQMAAPTDPEVWDVVADGDSTTGCAPEYYSFANAPCGGTQPEYYKYRAQAYFTIFFSDGDITSAGPFYSSGISINRICSG